MRHFYLSLDEAKMHTHSLDKVTVNFSIAKPKNILSHHIHRLNRMSSAECYFLSLAEQEWTPNEGISNNMSQRNSSYPS